METPALIITPPVDQSSLHKPDLDPGARNNLPRFPFTLDPSFPGLTRHLEQETSEKDALNREPALPVFDSSIFTHLPDFLRRVLANETTTGERDILLSGTLATLSACFPKVYGIYDGRKVHANLFLFISAPASSGKGRLILCRNLVKPIHHKMREESKELRREYEREMALYRASKGEDPEIEKPARPPEKMFFIPANNSATGLFQLLSDNEGRGLIFETEGDTLSRAFKSSSGNFSDGFRKAFHHETISYYRRTDHENVDMENPCLSAVLSGTPGQIPNLIDSSENGLFSRFIFYHLDLFPAWKNVFAGNTHITPEEYFNRLGSEFFDFYTLLSEHGPICFQLTSDQEEQFNAFFARLQDRYLALQGKDYMPTVRRLGLIAFRIAMIFTTLRMMESGNLQDSMTCSDEDFNSSVSIVEILAKHASHVFSELPSQPVLPKQKNLKEKFLDALPFSFSKPDYMAIASSLTITGASAERYISDFVKNNLLTRDKRDSYVNPYAKSA